MVSARRLSDYQEDEIENVNNYPAEKLARIRDISQYEPHIKVTLAHQVNQPLTDVENPQVSVEMRAMERLALSGLITTTVWQEMAASGTLDAEFNTALKLCTVNSPKSKCPVATSGEFNSIAQALEIVFQQYFGKAEAAWLNDIDPANSIKGRTRNQIWTRLMTVSENAVAHLNQFAAFGIKDILKFLDLFCRKFQKQFGHPITKKEFQEKFDRQDFSKILLTIAAGPLLPTNIFQKTLYVEAEKDIDVILLETDERGKLLMDISLDIFKETRRKIYTTMAYEPTHKYVGCPIVAQGFLNSMISFLLEKFEENLPDANE